MATRADIEADLTFEITGSVVTPERFQRALVAFFGLLAEVTKAVTPEGEHVDWRVQVRQGSNLVGISPGPGVPTALAVSVRRAIMSGLETLEHAPAEPPQFSEKALVSVTRLASSIGTHDDDDTVIRIWGEKAPVPVTPRLARNVAELLGEAYTDYGSVEGRLRTISEAGAFRIVIYEPIFSRSVPCNIPERLMQQALSLFGRRVEVYGDISYRRNGFVSRVSVQEIVAFPVERDLPDHEQVRGILQANT